MVSIIVPIYNSEKFLDRCISSICEQTYSDLEIILVDDGSSDGSGQICDGYADKDNRVKVIHKKNEGLVKARKDGIIASSGDYISFVDSDDWIDATMIEKLYNTLLNEAVDVSMCGRYEVVGDSAREVYHGLAEGRYDYKTLIEKVYPYMIVNNDFFEWGIFPGLWDKLFKRKYIERFEMCVDDRLTMGEDAACVYPLLLNVESIFILKECLYFYRQTGVSMVKKTDNPDLLKKRFEVLYKSVMNNLKKYIQIYDVRIQWREYVTFLMLPRVYDMIPEISELDYLFPFSNVSKGSKVILYGMGTSGQLLFKFLSRTNFCNIIACVDKNYMELRKQDLPVISPDRINDYEYDFIVVTNSFAKVRNQIYNDLSKRYKKEKIQILDLELLRSNNTVKMLGLIEE